MLLGSIANRGEIALKLLISDNPLPRNTTESLLGYGDVICSFRISIRRYSRVDRSM
jgi:hypothetical protein